MPSPHDHSAVPSLLRPKFDGNPPVHKKWTRARGDRHSQEAYKRSNTLERCINRLKNWSGLASRYEKTATVSPAGLHIAGTFIWSVR